MNYRTALIEILKANDCLINGKPEIAEELSSRLDIGLDVANGIIDLVNDDQNDFLAKLRNRHLELVESNVEVSDAMEFIERLRAAGRHINNIQDRSRFYVILRYWGCRVSKATGVFPDITMDEATTPLC